MRIIERVLNGGTVLFNSNRVRLAVNVAKASFASSAKNEFVSSGTLLGFAHPNPARFDFISQFCSCAAKEKLFRCICTGIVFAFSYADAEQSPFFWTGFMR